MLDWLKLSETVEKTGVPYATVNRYVKNHAKHLKLKKEHNIYYIHTDSLAVLEQIRNLYKDGNNEKQVDRELSATGIPITLDVMENEVTTLEKTMRNLHENLLSLHEKSEKQEQFNAELLQQLKKQQKYIDERLEERDKNLIIALREIAMTKEPKKKWWHFWK